MKKLKELALKLNTKLAEKNDIIKEMRKELIDTEKEIGESKLKDVEP